MLLQFVLFDIRDEVVAPAPYKEARIVHKRVHREKTKNIYSLAFSSWKKNMEGVKCF